MFKKITSLLLALALTLTCVPALAMMVTYSSTDDAAAIYSMAAGNGCFYTLQSDSGNTFNLVRTAADTRASETLGSVIYPGDGDNAAAVSDLLDMNPGMIAVDGLFVEDGALYGVCTATGESWKLLDDSGAFAPVASGLTLDMSGLCADEAGAHSRLYQTTLFAQDGYLCWRGMDGNTGVFSGGRISLSTGEKLVFAVPDLYDLCAYKDGKAIGRIFNMATAIDQNTGTYASASEFGAIDLATGAYEKLGELTSDGTLGVLGVSGLQYTAQNDTLYYGNGSVVNGYTIGTGETRVSAYTGEGIMGTMNGRAAVSLPGYYAVSSNGLTIYALDTDAVQKGALRIFGEIGSDAHKSFAKNFPDIPTEVAGDYNSGLEALTNAMVSATNPYDVLLLGLNYMPVTRLIDKGYCTDLSQYPEIMKRVEGVEARFLEPLTVNGKLYGVPVSTSSMCFGVNMGAWEELGLTQDDLPTTYPELMDFIANWKADYADDYPDTLLFNYGLNKMTLFALVLDNYSTWCQRNGQALTFDNDLMRSLLTSLETIDFDELSEDYQGDYWSKKSLFIYYASLTDLASLDGTGYTPVPLALADGEEPVVSCNVSVLTLNPRSERQDDAIRYICNYLDNVDENSNIVLYPDHNDPVPNKSYDKDRKDIEDELAKQQKRLETADAEHRSDIEESIGLLQENLTELEKHQFNITAEEIALYRESYADKLVVCLQNVLYGSASDEGNSELSKLLQQYLDGSMTRDQWMKEMDKRMRMMQLEDQ